MTLAARSLGAQLFPAEALGQARAYAAIRECLVAVVVTTRRRVAVQAEDVLELYALLLKHGVQLWILGGWGVDALLERQTRPHKDLDAIVALDDLPAMTALLSERGFVLKEIWDENLWVRCDGHVALIGRDAPGGAVATAFVLKDAQGREIDVHVMRFDDHGRGTPAWNSTMPFPPDAFEGHGRIAGCLVRCLSAAMQMRTHTGYALQDKDIQELRLLYERFGVEYLEEHLPLRATQSGQRNA